MISKHQKQRLHSVKKSSLGDGKAGEETDLQGKEAVRGPDGEQKLSLL